MEYVIETSKDNKIDWEATGVDRILQNVSNIIQTLKYEVAYDRTLGIDSRLLQMPLDKAAALATTEIINQITLREPRAKVKSVNYLGIDTSGNMQFRVVVDI